MQDIINNRIIPEILSKFDNCSYLPIDGIELKDIFHSSGLNMKYLGIISE